MRDAGRWRGLLSIPLPAAVDSWLLQLASRMPAIKPIETVAFGCRFRSRLEARWAVALEVAGIKWFYEHEGFETDAGWYLPDFWLPELNTYLEVKSSLPDDGESFPLHHLCKATKSFGVIGVDLRSPEPWVDSASLAHRDPAFSDCWFYELERKWPDELLRQHQKILPAYATDQYCSDGELMLLCPSCGGNYLHIENAVFLPATNYEHANLSGKRGNVVRIECWCELCAVKPDLIIGHHKGQTFLKGYLREPGGVPFEHAITDAALRSGMLARFEHGESPCF